MLEVFLRRAIPTISSSSYGAQGVVALEELWPVSICAEAVGRAILQHIQTPMALRE